MNIDDNHLWLLLDAVSENRRTALMITSSLVVVEVLFLQADSRRSVEGFCKLVHSWESRSGGDAEALSGRQEDPQRQGENLRLYFGVSHCCWSGSEDDEGERGENSEGGAGEEEEGGGEHCFLIISIVTFYAGCQITIHNSQLRAKFCLSDEPRRRSQH